MNQPADTGEKDRFLDPSLFILTLILTCTPLILTGRTYNVESIKVLTFQLGTALLLLVMSLGRNREFGFAKGLDLAVIAYFIANFISFLFSEMRDRSVQQVEILTYQLLFYLLVRSSRLEGRRGEWIVTCWIGAALATSMVAIEQLAGGIDIRFGVPWGTRATGTFMQPTFLAAFLAATMPLSVIRLIRSRNWRESTAHGLILGVLVVALGLSLSRSGWLGAGAALLVLLILERGISVNWRRWVPLVLLGAAILVAVLSIHPPSELDLERLMPRSRSTLERLAIWNGTLRMIQVHPILGFGPGNFVTFFTPFSGPYLQQIYANENKRAAHAHSEWLHIGAETGLLGLGAWAAVMIWAYVTLLRASRTASSPEERSFLRGHLGCATALIVCAGLGLDQRFATSSMLLWYIVGIAASRQPPLGKSAPEADLRFSWFRKPLVVLMAVYLMWLPLKRHRADRTRMIGASYHEARLPEEAQNWLLRSVALEPESPETHFLLGRNYMLMGDPINSEKAYLEALRLDPFNPSLLYNLARLYISVNDFAKGQEILSTALNINPKFWIAARDLHQLEQMHRDHRR